MNFDDGVQRKGRLHSLQRQGIPIARGLSAFLSSLTQTSYNECAGIQESELIAMSD